ncbi:MAG: PIN domain-containing protein [Oscillospiraceae bacterium]|nr:PIN domain-containing protein [Oscillospiraceae bacterium]
MQAYTGYFENERFYPKGRAIREKGRQRAVLTLIDDASPGTSERLEEFDKIAHMLRSENNTEVQEQDKRPAFAYAPNADIIAYFIQGNEHVSDSIRAIITEGQLLVLPPTVFFELRRGFIRKPDAVKERTFDCICNLFPIGEMSVTAWEHAARIYADSRTAGYPVTDIITAAFCIAGGHKLITANPRRFFGVDGLSVVDWKA